MKSGAAIDRSNTSRLLKLFVFYPMLIGISLVHEKNLRATAKYILNALQRKADGQSHDTTWRPAPGSQPPLALLAPERLLEMIRNPCIRVVSFDIFDTLLVRPSVRPKDVFHLLARKVNAVHGVDFITMRLDAEERMGMPNATLRDIYTFIQNKYQLSPEVAAALMAEELRFEETLLTPRHIMVELHAEAARLGKRIIAVSDMYLPSDTLHGILQRKGLDVAAVYVSCEHGQRKSDGKLYDVVIAAEGVHPSEILHIGDNVVSDYNMALEKNITAVHYPSVFEMAFGDGQIHAELFAQGITKDPLWSLLLGFGLNQLYDGPAVPQELLRIRDLRHFSLLTVAPLLTGFCLYLAENKHIQSSYKRIYFASRDGYLPHKVYEVIQQHVPCRPGVYFHAGRRAYYPWLCDSFLTFAAGHRNAANIDVYTLHDFIKAYFKGDAVLQKLEAELSDAEKQQLFFHHKEQCLESLHKVQQTIDACMDEKRAAIKAYYTQVFDEAEARHLVFDMGYSGSIGKALTSILGTPTDKLYFWEEAENRKLDEALGTNTYVFMQRSGYPWSNLLHEELFSPCEGGTVGFTPDGPVQEDLHFSPEHRRDIACVQQTCLDFAEAFCRTLGDYAPFMTLQEPDAVVDVEKALFESVPTTTMPLFRNIVYPDPVHQASALSLEKKMEPFFPQNTVFWGTDFENPETRLRPAPHLESGHARIGIHVHVYHRHMIQEILRYLQDFPLPFDVYVTVVDEAFVQTAQNLFSAALLPRVGRVQVLTVPNRGRDTAPWVLGMRPYQADYDLFCHIHTKDSPHMGFGAAWRRYLFDNLLRPESVIDIFNTFERQPEVGCLFPAIHDGLRLVMTDVGVPLYGSEHEYSLITDLLQRMGFAGELRRAELFFPVGTMLWYRPHALRQLFTCALCLEEFAEEPIGVGGTLAHALERLPGVVARRNGYLAGTLTTYNSLRAS